MAITKKNDPNDVQSDPVFTYIVSNIGERLTSVRREDIDTDDLTEMEALFKLFSGARTQSMALLEGQSLRCKIQPFARFRDSPHWVINRWWTQAERSRLGPEEAVHIPTKDDLDLLLTELQKAIADYNDTLLSADMSAIKTREVALGEDSLFKLFIGKRVLKKDIKNSAGKIPVFSANVFQPFGYLEQSNVAEFTHPSLLWGIDGNFELRYIPAGQPFATTDHCGAIQILDDSIVPEFLLYAISLGREEESFTRSFRASLANMRQFRIRIPVKDDGRFDMRIQQEIASAYTTAKAKEKSIKEIKRNLDQVLTDYIK